MKSEIGLHTIRIALLKVQFLRWHTIDVLIVPELVLAAFFRQLATKLTHLQKRVAVKQLTYVREISRSLFDYPSARFLRVK